MLVVYMSFSALQTGCTVLVCGALLWEILIVLLAKILGDEINIIVMLVYTEF